MDAGAANGAAPPGGQRALEDLAEAKFSELMAKALGSAGRGAGGKSSEICPQGDLRLPHPLRPTAEGDMTEGREGTAPVQKKHCAHFKRQ